MVGTVYATNTSKRVRCEHVLWTVASCRCPGQAPVILPFNDARLPVIELSAPAISGISLGRRQCQSKNGSAGRRESKEIKYPGALVYRLLHPRYSSIHDTRHRPTPLLHGGHLRRETNTSFYVEAQRSAERFAGLPHQLGKSTAWLLAPNTAKL